MATEQFADTDIAIVGGGMVGLSLALLLARGAPDTRITVIEATSLQGLIGKAKAEDAVDLPSSFDARSSALAASSRQIFEQTGLWASIEHHVCPIKTIHVTDRGHPGATRLNADETGQRGLGYVIENRILGRVLMAAVSAQSNIRVVAPASVTRLTPTPAGMELAVGEDLFRARLAVVADGANSALLQRLGIHTRCQDYGQTAVIANLALAEHHQWIAYERFTDEGPMALLPLTESDGEHRAALVWTLEPERARRLSEADEPEFLTELHRRFGFRAGRILRCGARASYPLKLMVAEEQVRSSLAVAGNAAHFLHPVAGQGFNLALRDVAKLAQILIAGIADGESPGALALLERYVAAQRADQQNTIGFSHSLPAVFGQRSVPAMALRNAALIGLDLIGPARRQFAEFGAGLSSSGVRLNG